MRLAVELASLGADVVVVGSTARMLRDGGREPRDLDVVVDAVDVDPLVAALRRLGLHVPALRLLRCRDVHLSTGWGPLDVFVGAPPDAFEVRADGVRLSVVSA